MVLHKHWVSVSGFGQVRIIFTVVDSEGVIKSDIRVTRTKNRVIEIARVF